MALHHLAIPPAGTHWHPVLFFQLPYPNANWPLNQAVFGLTRFAMASGTGFPRFSKFFQPPGKGKTRKRQQSRGSENLHDYFVRHAPFIRVASNFSQRTRVMRTLIVAAAFRSGNGNRLRSRCIKTEALRTRREPERSRCAWRGLRSEPDTFLPHMP